MILSDDQKKIAIELLKKDTPIPIIKEKLNLPDADLLYEVFYDVKVENRTTISTSKYLKTTTFRKYPTSYEMVISYIDQFR